MACVGTADEPAASGTSDRAAVPSGVSTGIHIVLAMRDGDKNELRDKGILKAVVNIIDMIAHKFAGYGRLGIDENRQVAGRHS